MGPILSLGTGVVIGLMIGATLDRYHNPFDNREGLIGSIAGLAISIIGLVWGNLSAGFATVAAITATFVTMDNPKKLVPKLLIRLTFSILFGALGLGITKLLA